MECQRLVSYFGEGVFGSLGRIGFWPGMIFSPGPAGGAVLLLIGTSVIALFTALVLSWASRRSQPTARRSAYFEKFPVMLNQIFFGLLSACHRSDDVGNCSAVVILVAIIMQYGPEGYRLARLPFYVSGSIHLG
jgi:hypothetical protein